jgi:hypothetical protein
VAQGVVLATKHEAMSRLIVMLAISLTVESVLVKAQTLSVETV